MIPPHRTSRSCRAVVSLPEPRAGTAETQNVQIFLHNHALINDSWWYRKYAPGDTVLDGLETEAQARRIGLWADPQPVPPWECWKRK